MPESTNSVTKSLREHCADLLAQCDAGEMAPVEALEDIRATLARPEPTQDLSQLSDGCHTFAELYQHRHALCLALMRAMPQHCWFSWRHADGEQCFGSNDWFIAGIELPGGSSVTYHLPAELYPAAQATGATELAKGRPWDGHTSSDVAMRLKEWAALAQPEPQGPTDDGPTNQEIEEWADAAAQVPLEEMDPEVHGWRRCFKPDEFGETIRAALARFGRPAIEPVDDRIAELEAELERERLRLAACGVVAMADTPESASKARDIHQDFWSASLDDVIRQVDALMALRLAIEPVPVSERLPGPGEWVWHCYAKVRFWQHGQHRNGQFFVGNGPESFPATHWRPHWALPVPQQEGQP